MLHPCWRALMNAHCAVSLLKLRFPHRNNGDTMLGMPAAWTLGG